MSKMVKVLWGMRRLLRAGWILAVSASIIVATALGELRPEAEHLKWLLIGLGTPWVVALSVRAYQRLYAKSSDGNTKRLDFDLGLLLLAAGQGGIQYSGGLSGPYDDTTYILVAFLDSYAVHPVGLTLEMSLIHI